MLKEKGVENAFLLDEWSFIDNYGLVDTIGFNFRALI